MIIKLLPEQCIACGLCQTYSSRFDYDDDGIVKFSQTDQDQLVLGALSEDDKLAIKSCPTRAITLMKSETTGTSSDPHDKLQNNPNQSNGPSTQPHL